MNAARARRQRRKGKGHDGHLSLVPFIDMLTILVVFMLLHTADVDILPNTKNIKVPESVSDVKPRETLVVMVTQDMLYVNGTPVASTAEISATDGNIIRSLRDALASQSAGIVKTDAAVAARQEVTIMGDKSIPYTVLKKVMATCTDADFGKVSLAVLEREVTA